MSFAVPMPDGYSVRSLAEVDSTNAEAARVARDLSGPTWINAKVQTAARGRRGRPWSAPTGNFAATLVLRPTEPPQQVALRSFVASLALYDACVACTGRREGFSLKWPNDVLLNGGKLAGILLESLGNGTTVASLAIGIGVNLKDAPQPASVEPGALRPVSLLGETGAAIEQDAFLQALAVTYAHWETQFVTYGFAPVQTAWLARAARLGDVITARLPKSEITGTFETVDGQGNLVLKTAKGRELIAAADIFF